MKERAILHSDANCFYASVEIVLNPSLRGKSVAVCGLQEDRHGIVLAKSEKAKKAGVKTGMAIWQAKACDRDIIIVPPRYDYYLKFSKLLHSIYRRYTDLIEPFGMDECWLDVTDTKMPPMQIAEEIRQAVKNELGLTVSIGVSFNKIFAKLGSDYKKPDAITEITRQNFRDVVWHLPCSDLLYCGRATTEKLARVQVKTIGDIANLAPDIMKKRLGKNGLMLWKFANGLDDSRVAYQDYISPAKSVGHGITCVEDLENLNEVKMVIYALAQDIGYKLRAMNLKATGIQLWIRNNELMSQGWQRKLTVSTDDEAIIADTAFQILCESYDWQRKVRSVTVSAYKLVGGNKALQMDLFNDFERIEKRTKINGSIDFLRDKYGKGTILPAIVLGEKKMPVGRSDEIIMPSYMYV